MYKRIMFCFMLAIFMSFGHSCAAQNSSTTLNRIENNEELKYVLTYLEPSEINLKSDEKEHFFVKSFKIKGHTSILINLEEPFQKEYYYFLVSSYDEATHLEAQLFKTQEFVNPSITRITESENGKEFLIYVAISESEEKDSISAEGKNIERNREIIFKINKY